MNNGNAKWAIIAVSLLTLIGVLAAVFIFSGETNLPSEGNEERVGILVASIFGFLTPTIGILLLIAQGQRRDERTAQIDVKATHIDEKADKIVDKTDVIAKKVEVVEQQTDGLLTRVQGQKVSSDELKRRV